MSTNENTVTEKLDVYAKVTSQIIAAIGQGVGNWTMPWHTSGRSAVAPINATSRKPYRGINTVCLWAAAESKGFDSGEWGTYQQWQELGAQVRKGEKSTTVVFWKFANNAAETEDRETAASGSRLLFTRGYSVFNAAQVDGYSPKVEPVASVAERIERAETWFQSIGADVRNGGNRAYYAPGTDHIQMPPFTETCRSLAADGLDYAITFSLTGDSPYILITASGNLKRKAKPVHSRQHRLAPPVKSQQCAVHRQETEWFLPENREKRNANTTHWRNRSGRYEELNAMAEENLRLELEYWRELELLSGQREHFKPGRTDETAYLDDEVAA